MPISIETVDLPDQPSLVTPPFPSQVLSGIESPIVAKIATSGELNWAPKYNANAAMIDILARAIGKGIVTGLTLSAVGLALSVADGLAIIDGVVEAKSIATYSLPASKTVVWIWLKQDGTITHSLTTAAPAFNAILLGSCATGASSITGSFDYSGVIYVRSGLLWRETADAGAPADTLDASMRVYTKTAGGLYLWTGASHTKID